MKKNIKASLQKPKEGILSLKKQFSLLMRHLVSIQNDGKGLLTEDEARAMSKNLTKELKRVKKLIRDDGKSDKLMTSLIVELGLDEPISELLLFDLDKNTEKMHPQARSLLKIAASLVGKETEQISLFKSPIYDNNVDPYKQTLSKNTVITGQLLIRLWQENKDDNGIYKIKNLSEIAKLLGTSPQELKIYLIYLGGYQYPVTTFNKEKRILSTYSEKLFYIKFNCRLKDNETEDSINNDYRIGTHYSNFIKNRDIESIDIVPNKSIRNGLQGKEFGNVLVSDAFVAFSLGLSDMAYKLFCFSGSNRPTFKIGFKKLIKEKYLNLEKQVYGIYDKKGKRIRKGQGKKRVIDTIIGGLTELKEKGHLTEWGYDEAKDQFSWTYTDKIIKHKELLDTKVLEGFEAKNDGKL